MNEAATTRCGLVAIVGRPNVGKSTLLNRLVGQKISITAPRRQTTRHRILGIKTVGDTQSIYVDTPGLHRVTRGAMSRYLNKAASTSLQDVDVVVLVSEDLRWTDEDEYVLARVRESRAPVILVVNKVDTVKDKAQLLPHLGLLATKMAFAEIIPISAVTGESVDVLEAAVARLLPLSEFYFPAEQVTDRSERFLAAEVIREKLTRKLGQELPYALTVLIEEFKEEDEFVRISALILVERAGQKKIVVGKGGSVLKEVGRQARLELERALDSKVFLRLWVKVREGWSDDEQALRSLGYHE